MLPHPRTVADLDNLALWREKIFVALPETHRLAGDGAIEWSALRDERFIVGREQPGPQIHDYVVGHLKGGEHVPVVTRYAVSHDGLMGLVGLGFGVCITSEAASAIAYPGVVCRPLAGPQDVVAFCAVWSPDNDNPALRRFVSLARTMVSPGLSF
jgi:DNA-binding transcriptional LysR family regulator